MEENERAHCRPSGGATFLNHRLEPTGLAGIIGRLFTICPFADRFYADHVWSWDLFAVIAGILGGTCSAMAHYKRTG